MLLCALGVLFLVVAGTNTAYWYVRPAYWWVLLAAGFVFLMWGVVDMPGRLRPLHAVLVVPVAAGVLLPGPVLPGPVTAVEAGTDGGGIVEVLRRDAAGIDVAGPATLEGQLLARDGWWLTRVRIVCCAADATTYGIRLSTPPPVGLHSGDWVRVTGQLSTQPLLLTGSIEPIPPRQRPYL
ncbi:hypothetical protein C1Y63_04065 [Corynebacterium sp. 13CS0277]|nr:hypothetical protein C1Y63_04065 [Corynebacterium sp. 13CS0277]